MVKLGAHLSISGGYAKALKNIKKIGGNCLQIFSISPRGWTFAKVNEKNSNQFIHLKSKLKIDPVFFHTSYLINLADTGRIGQLSKQFIKHELNIASQYGIKGTIIHLGSYKHEALSVKHETLIGNIKEILCGSPQETLFIIENAGNKKIGQNLKEIAKIIKEVNNQRVRVCLDTCHLYSAGYDLSTPEKIEQFIKVFDSLIGLEKLELFHFNDSKDPFHSGRDRHENIGQGNIPVNEFKLIMTHLKLKHLPFIIETPGFNNEGPDKKNLDVLKSLL